MSNILLITSEYKPFNSSGIGRLSFFQRYLEEQGHNVFILTTFGTAQGIKSTKEYDEKNRIYRAYSLSLFSRRVLSNRRFPVYLKIAKLGKYDTWVPFAVRKGVSLVTQLKINLVLSSFPDFASVCVAEKIATLSSTKLITDFRDPPYWIYDQIQVDKKTLKHQSVIEKVVRNSDQVIVCTQESRKSLSNFYDIGEKITEVNNGYDLDVISAIIDSNRVNQDVVEVVHIGSFYSKGRDIKPAVIALEKLAIEKQKKIHFRLIGDAPDDETIREINEVAKSLKISIEPPVPVIQALTIAKQADVLLLLQGSRFDRQIPTKLYEYLALNRVIWAIVGIEGETHKLLKGYMENVVLSNYDDQGDIDDGALKSLGLEAKYVDCLKLSRQEQAKNLINLIDSFSKDLESL